ncbi:MAG: PAS domain S-box protein [Thermodesulfobacteriota bacterium]
MLSPQKTAAQQTRRALVVETDPDTRHLLQKRLTELDFAVQEAPTGAAALLHNTAAYHLLFIQHRLPDMDGLTVLRAFATQIPNPVCILKTHRDEGDVEIQELVNTGALHYILKESDSAQRLERVLNRASADLNTSQALYEATRLSHETQDILQQMLDGTQDVVGFQYPDHTIIRFNKAGYDLLGLPPEEVNGKKCYELIGRDTECEVCATKNAYRSKRVERVEIFHPEMEKYFKVTATPILNESGDVQYFIEQITDISEHKRIEAALRESEKRFRGIYEHVPVGIAQIGLDCTIQHANPAYCAMLGREEHELQGVHIRSITHFDDIDNSLYHLELLIQGQIDHYRLEKRYRHRQGHVVHGILDTNLIRDPAGQPSYSLASVVDVTEQKETEEALREQKERQTNIIEATNVGTWEWNVQTGETIFNERWAEMIGYTLEELAPISIETWWQHTHPEDLKTSDQVFQKHFSGASDYYECECRMRHKDGHWVWVLDRGKVVSWSPDGNPLWVFGTHTDITARKQAEHEVIRKEQDLRATQKIARLGSWRLDVATNVVTWSDELYAIFGLDPASPLPSYPDLKSFFEPESWERLRTSLRQTINTGIPYEHELQIVKADGTTGWCWVWGEPIRDENGNIVELWGTTQDITARKTIEQEQEKLQAQLVQAQKMESVGLLAGGIAHDFNNLLHTISGNIELLARDKTSGHPEHKRLQIIRQSIDRATELIRQMLLFSRKAQRDVRKLDLNTELQNIIQLLERTIPKMIDIELHLDPEAWYISADPVQVEQVIFNLGSNAENAMPSGGRLIMETQNTWLDEEFVRLHTGAHTGPHLRMSVTDTGYGMDRETLTHVFEPFFTTKEVGKGTGLGLASVYGVVKAHNGYIQCYSEKGQGTTFHIYWPAVPDATDESAPEASGGQTEMIQGTETILVVDDDDTILDLTTNILELHGYTVVTALSGEEALSLYAEHHNDIALVVLDLNMPGMGGASCLQHLRELDPQVRVVLASGYSAQGQAREAAQMASGFLTKPYQLNTLLTTIREVLGDPA